MEQDPFIIKVQLGDIPYWIDMRDVLKEQTRKPLSKEFWDIQLFCWPWGTDTDIECTD